MGVHYNKADFITYGRPSLFLDFANKKSLTDRISGNNLITFTRTSTGTYVGADGLIKTAATDEPRFDHNPVTGESLGLLIEEQRSKIVSSFGYPLGSLSATTSTDIVSPDGTTSGITKITSPSFDSTSGLQQRSLDSSYFVHDVTANQYYTSSCYVYATGVTDSSRTVTLGNVAGGCLDAAGGPVLNSCGYIDGSSVVSSNTAFDVVLPRNKWVRVFLNWRSTCTSGAGRSAAQVRVLYWIISNQTNTNFINSAGNPVMYLWGMTVETSGSTLSVSFPTSYIYGSSVTRTADSASITGTNFSSWYNQSQGTAYVDIISRGISNSLPYQTYFSFNSSAGDRWGIAHQNGTSGAYPSNSVIPYVGTGGAFSNTLNETFSAGQKISIGMHQPNGTNIQSSRDGGSIQTVSTSRNPLITNLLLGGQISDNSGLMGTLKRFTYYPTRLTNAQLQNLTR